MRNHGNSLREIASHIKKSYSTISRELSRNSTGKSYSPSTTAIIASICQLRFFLKRYINGPK
ncbi:helix-turn-helix domain-containing protein [Lentilactobacillus parabuchneri]|uniref:helix-turn-helix domain-containing protein n=1 Tax=Lentilactobacillus parabuchneri TaxID=152331 RepID=UPI002235C740|nr:helix-turn-helix domain-containing protein [Lentilactobacillus parabuchneri]MCW4399812.1 helix-turn-helix domain-containing protein [Lentilactobacillus parabuchneri]